MLRKYSYIFNIEYKYRHIINNIYLEMIPHCGRKLCVCRKDIINWYMKAPYKKKMIWNNQLTCLKKKQKRCLGSYKVMVENMEIESIQFTCDQCDL